MEEKVLIDPMFELAYRDCTNNIRHLQIFGNDGFIEEKLSSTKFKIDEEKFEELLRFHFEGLKVFEKSLKCGLETDCHLEALLNGEHVFIPLSYNKDTDEESKKNIDNLIKTMVSDFTYLFQSAKVTLDDVEYDIKSKIKALPVGSEFSMREIFSNYIKYFWGVDDAYSVYKNLLADLKYNISQLDKFGDKFVRVEQNLPFFNFFDEKID